MAQNLPQSYTSEPNLGRNLNVIDGRGKPNQKMSAHPYSNEHEEAIPSYLTRLTQAPLLTADEEHIITRAALAGDKKAKQRLIESNMRLVINIARSYKNRSIPLEDLIQEGAIGLMQAVERFDPERGFRFSTYATHWVRQAIGRAIDNKAKAIRIPTHISQSLRRIEREKTRLTRELGHEPTTEQVAFALGISPNRLATIMQSSQDLISLDITVSEGGSVTLGSLLKDEKSIDPESRMMTREMVAEIQDIILELNDRERRVMQLRYRTDGEESDAEAMALAMDMSKERVRQIEMQALKKLRNIATRRHLIELLNK